MPFLPSRASVPYLWHSLALTSPLRPRYMPQASTVASESGQVFSPALLPRESSEDLSARIREVPVLIISYGHRI